jgi:hypothetical protein
VSHEALYRTIAVLVREKLIGAEAGEIRLL